jgi:clan AA aspartic protease
MVQGYVNEALEPVIEIGLKRGEVTESIPTIVDTGFSGHLCLSKRHEEKIEMVFHHVERYELANGEIAVMDVFRGTIVFDGREQEVNLILTASEDTLIGAALLSDYLLTINYPERIVRIERVQP